MVSVGQGIISLGLTSLDEYPLEVQNCRRKKTRALSVIMTACDDQARLTVQALESFRVIDIAAGNESI